MEDWIMAVLFNRPKDRMKNTFYEWILVFLCIYICSIGFSESAASRGKCQHGTFTNGTCVCISGWGDKNCDKCYGRARLSKDEGFITDGQGNYSLATKCSWLIDIPEANQTVWFKFYEFATECGWDHLYIHDGDSSFSPVLAAFSGLILTRNNNSDVGFAANVSSKHMYIHFSSDAAYTMAGFNISYSVTGCYLGCSNHGICDNNICKCNEGFTGQGCETTVCPNNCSSNGDCIGAVCKCKPEYKGEDCSISESGALWEIVNTELSPGGRASHVAITEKDLMWVVGGYTLTQFSTRNIHRYNFTQKKWSKVREQGPSIPPPRYAHASDLHDNKLYMYGGVVNGRVMNDMWVYNIINTNWTQLTSSPYNVSGHTAHIVDGIMYVFFGYSPKYGYMRIVQEYDIANDKWSVPITHGAIVHGGYSHSSVIHVDSSGATCIYIYGGYHSDTQSGYNLTDKLYMYNSRTKTWTVLRSSGSPRYLHSAVVLDGIILIFGGNTHNDTSVSKGAKCYSTDFMAYDIECNSWHFLPQPNLSENIARYGQSMVQHQGFVYMYGGFNGRMLKDLIKFSPGKCIAIKDKDVCSQSFPGTKCVWFQEHCATRSHLKNFYVPNCDPSKGGEKLCKQYKSCTSCNNTSYDCVWCNNGCFYKNCSTDDNNPPGNCTQSDPDNTCDLQHNCYSCIKQDKCRWTNKCMDKIKMINLQGDEVKEDTKLENVKTGSIKDNFEQCELPCSMYTTCENCTGKTCMWCSNMKQCVGTNSYVVSFPYGQCTDWTTKDEKCPATRCSGLRSCSECQANSVCGWCNDPSNTGLGRCMEGGDTGPVDNSHLTNNSFCPVERWYFTECPDCQCNGHSTCHENTSICEMCQDLTEGPHCEYCQTGYFGNPRNGGNCSVCECNDQADLCDRESGKCHCRTRGVTGDKCDTCDKTHSYVGDPTSGGTCYYQLVTDYQFTFNLSKAEDKYLTQINFMNIPAANDRDVDFTLNCSGLAFINITYKSKSQPEEQYVVSGHECDLFRTKFEHKDYNFGGEENTTFLVYVYGYKTPFWLVISFSQFPKIDLIHFFVTFFSCFLSLLLIAAALWKIKHKYDSYRRRQQLIVEMQQMASRPFASVTVEIGMKPKDKMLESLLGKDVMDTHTSRKRKKFGPGAIAIEPLNTHKAAILSLVIQLPNGDEDFVPDGLTGVAVASTLVTLGNTRKQSVEHIRGDKSKLRKHLQHTHPETCA